MRRFLLPVIALGLVGAACAPRAIREAPPPAELPGGQVVGEGLASYYGEGLDGRLTASGERFDRHAFTAAHRRLPFGTCLRVVNLDNGRATRVRVNDRGPYSGRRILDVSEAAARQLGMLHAGVARVRLLTCP